MGRLVALMHDLFFHMKLAEMTKHLGVEMKVTETPDALQVLFNPAPKLLIVDLNSRNEPIATIQRLRAEKNDVRVVGFLSHVQRTLERKVPPGGWAEGCRALASTRNRGRLLMRQRSDVGRSAPLIHVAF